ncbi:MAG TPA: hypothetical protein VD931_15385 [Baekduia sp.]|nr:hypothetical protein [Baekduia sp.]
MQDAFFYVVIGVTAVAAVLAVWSFARSGEVYDQIGRGGMSLDDGPGRALASPTGAVAIAERDDEIRQMLEARNRRRTARGEAPVDVEAELAALTRPRVDRELLLEVRELVESRNRRLVRQGKEPLDVEAEVARRLRDIGAA